MKVDNPFDRALKARQVLEPFRGAAIDVTDTLDLAWASAQAVFEDAAEPQHAIQIAELMLLASGRIASTGSRPSRSRRTGTRTSDG